MTNPNLPRALALSGIGLQTIDYVTVTLQGKADAKGTITLTPPDEVSSGQLWRIERITVTPRLSVANDTVQCGVYGGSPDASTIRDWVDLPQGTVGIAEYPQPITIDSATLFTIQLTGATVGDSATAVVQYAVVQRAQGG